MRKIAAAKIRIAPTSPGEKTSNPRLISINELPQIKARTINKM
jgi:hypothetical protein